MPNAPWNPANGVKAFTAALTRAGHDKEFRDRLIESSDSARQAVAEEGAIDIPDDIMMMFHEDKQNEKYHVFYLPPFDPNNTTVKHEYRTYFMCCYNPW